MSTTLSTLFPCTAAIPLTALNSPGTVAMSPCQTLATDASAQPEALEEAAKVFACSAESAPLCRDSFTISPGARERSVAAPDYTPDAAEIQRKLEIHCTASEKVSREHYRVIDHLRSIIPSFSTLSDDKQMTIAAFVIFDLRFPFLRSAFVMDGQFTDTGRTYVTSLFRSYCAFQDTVSKEISAVASLCWGDTIFDLPSLFALKAEFQLCELLMLKDDLEYHAIKDDLSENENCPSPDMAVHLEKLARPIRKAILDEMPAQLRSEVLGRVMNDPRNALHLDIDQLLHLLPGGWESGAMLSRDPTCVPPLGYLSPEGLRRLRHDTSSAELNRLRTRFFLIAEGLTGELGVRVNNCWITASWNRNTFLRDDPLIAPLAQGLPEERQLAIYYQVANEALAFLIDADRQGRLAEHLTPEGDMTEALNTFFRARLLHHIERLPGNSRQK